jgi:drug/metabolite transporter (DMT)-like permease
LNNIKNSSQNQSSLVIIAFIAICIIWGTTYFGIKIALEEIPPFMLSSIRHLIAGCLFVGYFRSQGHKFPTDTRTYLMLFFIGTLIITGGNAFVCVAEKFIPSSLTAIISALSPLYITAMSIFILKNTAFTPKIALGFALSIFGVVVLSYPNLTISYSTSFLIGLVLMTIANLSWSLGTVLIKKYPLNVNIYLGMGIQMWMGGLVNLIISLCFEKQRDLTHLTSSTIGAMTYMILIGSFLGYMCYMYLLKHINPARLSTHNYANTVVAVFVGWLIGKETLNIYTIFATAIILAGVLIVNREYSK